MIAVGMKNDRKISETPSDRTSTDKQTGHRELYRADRRGVTDSRAEDFSLRISGPIFWQRCLLLCCAWLGLATLLIA